tara:strand:- start:2510 stop:2911 length:402 start_codon:yes stop_codon:yes gene_type:complete
MEKVIVIDDTSAIRNHVRIILTKQGFNVLEAENGKLGIELIKENLDCALIIVDLNMPIMGGFEMLEILEEQDIGIEIPKVIFTTEGITDGENSQKIKEHGKELGVKTWFTKPLTSKREAILITTVKKLVEKYK